MNIQKDNKVGKYFWFEYHCYESDDSCDEEIWYRSHQKVKVLSVSEWSFDNLQDRIDDGQPRVYKVMFNDGLKYDVYEDELMNSTEDFYRPNPPIKNLQESIRRIIKEVRVPKSERVELYKDDNIIVVVPLTHRALQKYAHQCQWCINDDIGEWEDYHKGKHAVIIQRNPKKPKIGITGNPTESEIFLLSKWDNNQSSFEDVCQMLDYEFRNDRTMSDYYVTISNNINNFATNIVYYSPETGIYDQEDNFLWNFNIEINDIPNVKPKVIEIMDDYLQENEEMNLQESIRRIVKEELHSPAGDKYKPNKYVVHKSAPHWRENIELTGLQTSVGDCYQIYVGGDVKCKKAIFATDSLNDKDMFDSTYDDDIWIIDTECAGVSWFKDKHYFKQGDYNYHIVTFKNISPDCLELIHKGTGKSY